MRLLLDTHALIWMISDDRRLGSLAKQAIQSADEIHWSIISLWEIGIKQSLDRFDLGLAPGWQEWIPAELQLNKIRRLNVEPAHCHRVSTLPLHHRDPFDRMFIAQAQVESLHLVTCDRMFDPYGVTTIW